MTRGVDQPFEGLTLNDKIPGGLGHEARAIAAAAGLWGPESAAGFETLEEYLEWTFSSRRLDPPPRGGR